jgi:hypothetical protein
MYLIFIYYDEILVTTISTNELMHLLDWVKNKKFNG